MSSLYKINQKLKDENCLKNKNCLKNNKIKLKHICMGCLPSSAWFKCHQPDLLLHIPQLMPIPLNLCFLVAHSQTVQTMASIDVHSPYEYCPLCYF